MQILSELYQMCENSQGPVMVSLHGGTQVSMPCWSLGDEIPGGELRGFPALFLSKKIMTQIWWCQMFGGSLVDI